jgi:hypothetical protein
LTPLHRSRALNRYEASKDSMPLTVDPDSPCMRDFVLRHVLKGTIRVIPAGRGKLAIIPTSAWFLGELMPPTVETECIDGPRRRPDCPGDLQ